MAFLDIFKILILPGLIALALYFTLIHFLLPLYRIHHSRYANYLPLHNLNLNLSERTSGIRGRIRRLFLPSYMHWRHDMAYDTHRRGSVVSDEEEYFGVEEGESMVGFGFDGRHGRLPVRREDGRVEGEVDVEIDSQRRLSRELEEGFKDESEDEEGGDDRRR